MPQFPFIRTIKVSNRIQFDLAAEYAWTKMYRCIYKARGYSIGVIKLNKKQNQYVYYPTSNCTLSPDCLKDIIEFLAEVNQKGKVGCEGN